MLDPVGRVLAWNAGAGHIKGYAAQEIIGRSFEVFYTGEDRASGQPAHHLEQAAASGHVSYQGWRVRKDGSRFWADVVLTAIYDDQQHLQGFGKVTRDLTERRNAEQELMHRAVHDTLTGLPNRTLLLDRLTSALARLRRQPEHVALLLIDLDRFKTINDTLGHAVGDGVLIAVAQRLQAAVRSQDTVARLSGDEFVVLCEGLAGEGMVAALIDRLIESLAAPVVLGHERLPLSVSIGIALTGRADHEPESLLRDADAALYRAKLDPSGRRVRFQLFDPVMRDQLAHRLELERALRHAIEREEFHLAYQPVVDLNAGRLASFEALLRWDRPQHGPVAPMDFIPLAEASKLIAPLGAWVLDQACRQLLSWDAHVPDAVDVAVNVSAHQLNDEFLDHLASTLTTTGLKASRICLELTESAVMADLEASARVLDDLKCLEVSLATDDFGTGYSSLSYLQRLPFDIVKIDRSFVNGLGVEPADSAIVAATIKMAQALDIRVIAEGVEPEPSPRSCSPCTATTPRDGTSAGHRHPTPVTGPPNASSSRPTPAASARSWTGAPLPGCPPRLPRITP